MAKPQPATIVSELVKEINGLVLRGHVDEPSVQRIRNKAKGVANIEPGPYHMLLGQCECLLGRLDPMERQFEAALRISEDSQILLAYGLSWSMWGFRKRAIDVVRRAYAKAPDDVNVIRAMYNQEWYAFQFADAARLLDVMDAGSISYNEIQGQAIRKSSAFVSSLELSKDSALEIAEAVGTFLRDKKVFNPGMRIEYYGPPDSQEHVVCTIAINDELDRAVDLNWELLEYLHVLNSPLEATGNFIFNVTITDNEDLRAA